jgi:hypothetical protein
MKAYENIYKYNVKERGDGNPASGIYYEVWTPN